MIRNALSLVVSVCVAAIVSAQTPLPSQAATIDIYTIYSAMITSGMTDPQRASVDEIYLIEETTATNTGGPGCVKAPAAEASILAEIVEEYNRRSSTNLVLARQFTLPKPYELLDRDKAAAFLKDALEATPQILPRGGVPPVNQNPLYAKAKRIFRLSEVYFDKSRTSALAWVGVYTTSMDFMETWRPYRKSASGLWEENRSWTACGRGRGR